AEEKTIFNFSNLPTENVYYIRAYGSNSFGINYSNEVVVQFPEEKLFEGDVVLTNDKEVYDFGIQNYSRVMGSVYISGSVSNLIWLNNLVIIDVGLEIKNTTQLEDLKGLTNLEAVGNVY